MIIDVMKILTAINEVKMVILINPLSWIIIGFLSINRGLFFSNW